MELKDRVTIITGASGGLGQAVARALGKEGAVLVLVDLKIKRSKRLLKELSGSGRKGMALSADVSRIADIKRVVERTIARFHRIDLLVNTAGICALTPIKDINEPEWDRILDVNLKGTFFLSQAVFKEMVKRKSGKIINFSSASAKLGGVAVGAHYSASKAGIICLTKSFALQGAPYHINVNCVCPGPMKTEMTDVWGEKINTRFKDMIPWKDYGEPEDVAASVLFLASDRARYITGEILDVNGGLVMD